MQFHRLQNISVTIQIKGNVSVLPRGSQCLRPAFSRRKEQYVLCNLCLWKKGQTQTESETTETDFLCFFSRSWLRLCRPSRWSLVSCSSAVIFWHFFFSCCTERCTSSLSVCRSASCSVHTNTRKQTFIILSWQFNAYHYYYISARWANIEIGFICRIIKSVLPFSRRVFCSAAPSPASRQTPAAVSSWWSPFHEWLGCILSATRLLEERTQNSENVCVTFVCLVPLMQV